MSNTPKPYYQINLQKLRDNYKDYLSNLKTINPCAIIAYSVKANYDYRIINELNSLGAFFEVCSLFEYNMLLNYGVLGCRILVNGLYYSPSELDLFFANNSMVIFDSNYALDYLVALNKQVKIGLRVNPDITGSIANHFFIKRSKFGFSTRDEDLFEFIEGLKTNPNISIDLVQMHVAGNTRDPEVYSWELDTLYKVIEKFSLTSATKIDLGGGFKIAPNAYCMADYIKAIATKNTFNQFACVVEIGNALVRNCVDYIMNISAIKTVNGVTYCIANGSSLHFNPHQKRMEFDYEIKPSGTKQVDVQIIVGKTCKESDVIYIARNAKQFIVGDYITIKNIGAYCMNETTNFLLEKPKTIYS